ncbi:MAG: LLM class flavin-dependent oxidoreductase [Chloroflexi bacterium]|nr:LLM class flavin-dependent oxidoreductase [Chloroflexota bacterium]
MAHLARDFQLGILFRRDVPPERLRGAAREAEAAGFDELWIVEDCFYAGGIASVATALADTAAIRVGLGITPAVARNLAFAAMDIAALARLHPGRFLPGIGHGVADWMRQIGALPASPLTAIEEIVSAIRALLHGEQVDFQGQYVQLDRVQLEYPPDVVPPVSLGVRGPKSLALAGRIADGTLLAEASAPAYVTWARQQIAHTPHRLTVYALCRFDDDPQAARDALRPWIATYISRERVRSQLEPLGIESQIQALLAEGGEQHVLHAMPDEWIDQLAVVGTPADCARSLRRLAAAGADSIVLVPPSADVQETWTHQAAEAILPLL